MREMAVVTTILLLVYSLNDLRAYIFFMAVALQDETSDLSMTDKNIDRY